MPTHDPRFFTLDEANRTLPLVRRIVRDIVEAYPEFQRKLQLLHELTVDPGPETRQRVEALREEVDRRAELVNDFVEELLALGCMFKGYEDGLVDFHSWFRGRPVCLCWKLGEERITTWHEADAGYAGRQPITPEIAEELNGRARSPAEAEAEAGTGA